jgi:hypothetical protein
MIAPFTIRYPVRPAARSLATGRVADLFGLADDEPPFTVCENFAPDVRPGDLVFAHGPSGSGKSSVIRELARQLGAVDAASLPLPDVPLVEAVPGEWADRLTWLAAAGLGEARLLVRRPAELSDGQRDRFRIVAAMGEATARGLGFVLLDEFTATLDRQLAKVVAFNLRKLVSRSGVGVLAATTHDDILDDLNPDVVIACRGDGDCSAVRRDAAKKASAASGTSGCRTVPSPIGRTSLGGITAATTSPSSAG